MRINHIRVAAEDYVALKTWFRSRFGWGTLDVVPLAPEPLYRQGIVPLPGLTGFELFGDVAPAHPFSALLVATPFAFVGWALRTDDIEGVAKRLARPSPAGASWVDAEGNSFSARWLMSGSIGLPYFIQYDVSPSEWPQVVHTSPPGQIERVVVRGAPDEIDTLESWIGSASVPVKTEVVDAPLHVHSVEVASDSGPVVVSLSPT